MDSRLQKFVNIDPVTGCWNWTGSTDSKGYGKIRVNKKLYAAHRYSYMVAKGDLGNLQACHICDNKLCVNPDHLFAGTQSANMYDMHLKGRHTILFPLTGARNHKTKLTVEQVLAIRAAVADGESMYSQAKKYRVRHYAIEGIIRRRTWKDVP